MAASWEGVASWGGAAAWGGANPGHALHPPICPSQLGLLQCPVRRPAPSESTSVHPSRTSSFVHHAATPHPRPARPVLWHRPRFGDLEFRVNSNCYSSRERAGVRRERGFVVRAGGESGGSSGREQVLDGGAPESGTGERGLNLGEDESAFRRLGTDDVAEILVAVGDEFGLPGPVQDRFWSWRGYDIRYQSAGSDGPPLLLVHGFGANCDHWRKNIGPLSATHRVFAVDLLGYGYSSKPDPRTPAPNLPLSSPFRFETWGEQINDFIADVIGEPAFVATNSVGGVAGLQAAVSNPALTRGVVLLNVSLRMLHTSKQSPLARPLVSGLQWLLRNTDVGRAFFKSVAKPAAIERILKECYGDGDAVTPELVELILKPGLEPGAVDVFLDFVCYSGGPLAEDLIVKAQCPVAIGWGAADPWEPVHLGRAFRELQNVEDFVEFPGVGHCPQDEAPHVVNPFIASFVSRYS